MAQPDDFGFGEEAALLKASANKFFTEHFAVDKLHQMVASEHDPEQARGGAWDRDLWQQMVDLGWTMLAVPESAGGVGMPVVAVAGLVEEVGRAAFPCPLLATLSTTFVLRACGAGAETALAEIAGGCAATLVVANEHGAWQAADTGVEYRDGKLFGSASFVQDAFKVERLLVSAKTANGTGLFWLAADAAGVTLHPDAIVDLTRDQAHIHFDGAAAQQVSDSAASCMAQAMPAIFTAVAADVVGAAEWQLQTTVEYVNARQQFEHPLGFFQAVKHPLVDVMIQIDETKSLVYNAACAIDVAAQTESGAARADQCAHMAKASASETAAFASGRSVQCHGGIGFTWECYLHLYFKRQKHSQWLWGDAAWHRARLADIVIGKVA